MVAPRWQDLPQWGVPRAPLQWGEPLDVQGKEREEWCQRRQASGLYGQAQQAEHAY